MAGSVLQGARNGGLGALGWVARGWRSTASTQRSGIVVVESRGQRTRSLLRVLVLGFAVIFVGGELADVFVARMPDSAKPVRVVVAAVVGVLVIGIAMPLIRQRGRDRASAYGDDLPP